MWARRCRPGRYPIRAFPFDFSRATYHPGNVSPATSRPGFSGIVAGKNGKCCSVSDAGLTGSKPATFPLPTQLKLSLGKELLYLMQGLIGDIMTKALGKEKHTFLVDKLDSQRLQLERRI
nr:hypothetical protein [Tanacetum cinerariifolium]